MYLIYSYSLKKARLSEWLNCLGNIHLGTQLTLTMFGFLKRFSPSSIPIVRIHGSINPKMTEQVSQQLQAIKGNVKALAVSINSPGGLPTQSDIIARKLRHYSEKHNVPLLTFAESVCASGGYYILCSGDQVYADKTSIVGSIGAISILFRMKELLDSWNIDVRKFTSSRNLLLYQLDQLDGDESQQKKILQPITDKIHSKFIEHVEEQRGAKLKGAREKLFDGSVFLGEEAQQLGLVDGVGSMIEILGQKYPQQRIHSIATKESRLQNFTKYLMNSG